VNPKPTREREDRAVGWSLASFSYLKPESRRLAFVLFALVLGVVLTYASALIHAGAVTAYATVAIEYGLYLLYLSRTRDPVFARLLVFGLIAGAIELVTDAWAVDVTRTLVYPADGPFLWRSPLYMPFAWGSTFLQLGGIAHWVSGRLPLLASSLALGLIGALDIPFYEQMAKGAGWWFYQKAPMLGNAPWYVIGTEILVVAALPVVARWVGNGSLGLSAGLGVALGAWIGVAALISYSLAGH
jgi:hypothetical protein